MKLSITYLPLMVVELLLSDVLLKGHNAPPLYFTGQESYIIVPEKDSVILPCQANVRNTRNLWFKDDVKIKDNISHTFRISSTHRSSAGIYRCVALNEFGGLRSTPMKLDVGYLDPPNLKTRSRLLIEVNLGQAVVLWPSSYAQISNPGGQSNPDRNPNKGQSFSLDAVPTPRAKWTMNNGPIPSTSTIYVSMVEQALVLLNIDWPLDSTVFRAHLANSYGNSHSRDGVYTQSFILTVKDPSPDAPLRSLHLVLPPKDVTVVVQAGQSGSATFECVFNARPSHALRVRWYHRRVGDTGPTQMKPIQPDDNLSGGERIYRFDRSGLNRSLTVLNILAPTVSPLTGLVQTYVEEFTCQAYLEAYPLPRSLVGMNEQNSYRLAYMSGPLSATARLRIHVTPRLRMSSLIGPQMIESTGQDQQKAAVLQSSVSSTLVIPCEFEHTGNPPATIQWYKNGRQIVFSENSRIFMAHNHSLVVEKVRGEDGGVYQCFARNEVGEDFLAFWLKVTSFAPQLQTVDTSELNVTVLEDESVSLICPVDAAPTPEYTWFKEQAEKHHWIKLSLEEMEDSGYRQYGNRLTLSAVQKSDGGLYRCEAINLLGSGVAQVHLSVFARTRPTIHLPGHFTALWNDSLQLPCVVSSHVDARVTFDWLHARPGQTSQPNKTLQDRVGFDSGLPGSTVAVIDYFQRNITGTPEHGSVLMIQHLKPDSAGVYLCRVTSKGGNISLSTEIQVAQPPAAPRIMTVHSQVNRDKSSSLPGGLVKVSFKIPNVYSSVPLDKYLLFAKRVSSSESSENCNNNERSQAVLISLIQFNAMSANESATIQFDSNILCPREVYCLQMVGSNALGWSTSSKGLQFNMMDTEIVPKLPSPEEFSVVSSNCTIQIVWSASFTNRDCFPQFTKTEYQVDYWVEGQSTHIRRSYKSMRQLGIITLTQLKPFTDYIIRITIVNLTNSAKEYVELRTRTKASAPSWPPKTIQMKNVKSDSAEIVVIWPVVDNITRIVAFKAELTCIDPPGCPNREFIVTTQAVNRSRFCHKEFEDLRSTDHSGTQIHHTGDVFTWLVSNLDSHTLYEARVAAISTAGIGPFSEPPEVFRTREEVPCRVESLVVEKSETDELHLHWKQPKSDKGHILHYIIKYSRITTVDDTLNFPDRTRFGQSISYWKQNLTSAQKTTVTKQSSFWYASDDSQQSHNRNVQPLMKTLTIESIRAEPGAPARVSQLQPNSYYILSVTPVSKAGSGPAGIVFGQTSAPAWTEQRSRNTHFLQWQSQHSQFSSERLVAIQFTDLTMRFMGNPLIWRLQDSTALINISITFEPTDAKQNSHSPWWHEPTRMKDFILRQLWPIQVQTLSASGFTTDWYELYETQWHWVPAVPCEHVIWLSTSSDNAAKETTGANPVLIATLLMPNLRPYTHYRLRVWQPLYTLFPTLTTAVVNVNDNLVLFSDPSEWFNTPVGLPRSAPKQVRMSILDEHRMKISWQPLMPSEWNGPPGGYTLTLERLSLTQWSNQSEFEELSSPTHMKYDCSHVERDVCGIVRQVVCVNSTNIHEYLFYGLHPATSYQVRVRAFIWDPGRDAYPDLLCGPELLVRGSIVDNFGEHVAKAPPMWLSKPVSRVSQLSAVLNRGDLQLQWSEPTAFPCEQNIIGYKLGMTHISHELGEDHSEGTSRLIEHTRFLALNDSRIGTISSATLYSHGNQRRSLRMSGGELLNLLHYPLTWNPCSSWDSFRVRIQLTNQRGDGPVSEEVLVNFIPDEHFEGVLSLRSIIINKSEQSNLTVGRVLLSWKVLRSANNQQTKQGATLRWYQIDPVTQTPVGQPNRRLINWPQSLNPGIEAEFLVAIDGLSAEATYKFDVEDGTTVPSENFSCSYGQSITVHVIPIEEWIAPYRKPSPPSRWLTSETYSPSEYSSSPASAVQPICNHGWIRLTWPAYPSSLQPISDQHPIVAPRYTAPAKNYSLQYIRLSRLTSQTDMDTLAELADTLGPQDFSEMDWISYKPSPQLGQEDGFDVIGLTHYSAYVFRMAVRTDAGMSPFSVPSTVMFTSPSTPCESPAGVSAVLHYVERSFLRELYGQPASANAVSGTCQTIMVQWKAISETSWNAEPRYYRLVYRAWPPTTDQSNRTLFIKPKLSKQLLYEVFLPPLPAQTYYQIQLAAQTDYGTGPSSDWVLSFTDSGCPQETIANSWFLDMNKHQAVVDKSIKYQLNVHGFSCSSNQEKIELQCTWIPVTDPSVIGYQVEIRSYGGLDTSENPTKNNTSFSLIIPPNATRLLLYSEPNPMEFPSDRLPLRPVCDPHRVDCAYYSSRTLLPYHRYTMHIRALSKSDSTQSRWSHAHNDERIDVVTPSISLNACDKAYLCSAQLSPTAPRDLLSQWQSRQVVQLSWSRPERLNGRLQGYRVTINQIRLINWEIQNETKNGSTIHPMEHFTLTSEYQLENLFPNSTYVVEVRARTEAIQSAGFGPPSCMAITTDACLSLSDYAHGSSGQECLTMLRALYKSHSNPRGHCVQLLPEMYRPTVRGRTLRSQNSISRPAFESNAQKTLSTQLHVTRVSPQIRNQTEEEQTIQNTTSISNQSAQSLEIMWTVGAQSILPVTQFLLEVRTSRNLLRWYPIRAVPHTSRQFTLFVDDSALQRAAHAQDNVNAHDKDVDDSFSPNIPPIPEVTRQMIAAAYAQIGVPLDSPSHVAIQFRLSAATPSQLGLPGPGSGWMIIAIEPPQLPVYRQWWFPVILAACSTLSIVILLILLRASVRRHVYKSRVLMHKVPARSQDLMLECCILNDTCMDLGATSSKQDKSLGVIDRTHLNGNCVPDGLNYVGAIPVHTSFYPVSDQQLAASLSPMVCVDSSWGSRTMSNKTSNSAEVHQQQDGCNSTVVTERPGFSCAFSYPPGTIGLDQLKTYPNGSVFDGVTQFDIPFTQSTLPGASHVIRAMDPTDQCPPITNQQFHSVTCDRLLLDDPGRSFHASMSPYQWSTCTPSSPPTNCCAHAYETKFVHPPSHMVNHPSPQAIPDWNTNPCPIYVDRGVNIYLSNNRQKHNPIVQNVKSQSVESCQYMTHYPIPSTKLVPCSPITRNHAHPRATTMEREWMSSSIHSSRGDSQMEVSPDLVNSVLHSGIRGNAYIIDSDVNGSETYATRTWHNSPAGSNMNRPQPELTLCNPLHQPNNLGNIRTSSENNDQNSLPCSTIQDTLASTEV